jgi:hypothetical protein
MVTDWSALCSPEDPVLVVPWTDPARNVSFVDLRSNPYEFDAIPEAMQYPALLQTLRALNATRSPVFTAKSDVWRLRPEELAELRLELDIDVDESIAGLGSYVDLMFRDKSVFTSSAHQQQWIARLLRLASRSHHPAAVLECTLRPALLDLRPPQEGYAVSLYVKAVGPDQASAEHVWASALADIVKLVRSRDLAR